MLVQKLFPPEKEATKFDKIIDLAKALSSGTPWGVVGQAIETTGKVCSTICAGHQRVQTVKYVKDAYEAKLRAEEELARIRERAERYHAQETLLTLYVEKSFQKEMDALGKEIILESHRLDIRHEEQMAKIRNQHEIAIRNLHQIDRTYANIIRRNEMYCLLYRQYLKYLSDSKTTPSSMIAFITQKYMDIIINAVEKAHTNPEVLTAGMDSAMKLLQFIGNLESSFIPFEQFISQKKRIEELT